MYFIRYFLIYGIRKNFAFCLVWDCCSRERGLVRWQATSSWETRPLNIGSQCKVARTGHSASRAGRPGNIEEVMRGTDGSAAGAWCLQRAPRPPEKRKPAGQR